MSHIISSSSSTTTSGSSKSGVWWCGRGGGEAAAKTCSCCWGNVAERFRLLELSAMLKWDVQTVVVLHTVQF
jgi:hypothetical protein